MASTKSPDRDTTFLELLASGTGLQWTAAANLLLASRPPGFAALLLSDMPLTRLIAVFDAGNGGSFAGSLSGGVSDGIGVSPPGYPPFAMYRFESGPRTGYVVLATGPRTVYYSRTVTYQYQFGISQVCGDRPNRAEYLAAMPGLESNEAGPLIRDTRRPTSASASPT
jgi:hypothetical protein